MPVIVSPEQARATRRRASSNGTGFWLSSYIGANRYTAGADAARQPGALYPMAFLVEQDPGAVVGAHYHQADQFQVMVSGSGRLGRHDVAAGSVHFTGAWSAYGPLAAGADGLCYFTLRNGWDPGARYMECPENRQALRAMPRGHRESLDETEPAQDGLCVRHHRLEAGARLTGLDPSRGAGQFWVVLQGKLRHQDVELPPLSCGFVAPDEEPFVAQAAAGGAELLAMQFPLQMRG